MYRYSIIFFCYSRYIVYGTGTVPLVPNSYKLRKHLRKTRSLLEPTSLAKKKNAAVYRKAKSKQFFNAFDTLRHR